MVSPVTPTQVVVCLLAAGACALLSALFARLDDAARRLVAVRARSRRRWRQRHG